MPRLRPSMNALLGLCDGVLLLPQAGVHMGIDVAGAQLLVQKIVDGTRRLVDPEVDHDGMLALCLR